MNQKELKELIEFLIEKDIAEFELERGDVKVRIRRGSGHSAAPSVHATPGAVVPMPIVAAPMVTTNAGAAPTPASPAAAPSSPAAEDNVHVVKSPIVGTFYESPSPGSPPFVKVGDKIETGQVLCIVEAMKLMNEIESDVTGEIVKKLVNNGQPVEYGQDLFAVRKSQ
jgi:acetyl-CoA carboxylase biotin carboxyl carrier protein